MAPKPTSFVVEHEQPKQSEPTTAERKIKKAAISMRGKLMTFPGAARMHCQKFGSELVIVVRVMDIKATEFPKELEYMVCIEGSAEKYGSDAMAVYKLKEHDYKVVIRLMAVDKVLSLKKNTNKIGTVTTAAWKKMIGKPVSFFVELGKASAGGGSVPTQPRGKVKRAAIVNRAQLMKFPGAAGMHCQEFEKDDYAIVVRVRQGDVLPKDLDYMTYVSGNDEKYGKDSLAVYKLKQGEHNVVVRKQGPAEIASLAVNVNKIGDVTTAAWKATLAKVEGAKASKTE